MPRRESWRDRLARLLADRAEIEAAEVLEQVAGSGTTRVADVVDRSRAEVAGVLRSVTLRPRAGVPALEADLFDGSGSMRLVWLGRRRIRGVAPGRGLRAAGRVATGPDGPVMYNPRYVLDPSPTAEE